jgi:hypothetical protein
MEGNMTKFFAHLRGNNIVSQPIPLQAQDLLAAKKEAWGAYGDGYKDHWIDICAAREFLQGEIEAGETIISRRMTDRAWSPVVL